MSGTADDPVELESGSEEGDVPWRPIVCTDSEEPCLAPARGVERPLSMAEKLLARAGYKNKGGGLGKAEQGMRKPIAVRLHVHNKGLGFKPISSRSRHRGK